MPLSVQTSELKESEVHDVLQKAGDAYLEENASHLREATRAQLRPYSEEAIRTLAQVLTGPERAVYHAESSSQKGKFYTLEVVGVDVTCDCPGFTHRGSCRHVRPLKSASPQKNRCRKDIKKSHRISLGCWVSLYLFTQTIRQTCPISCNCA